MLRECVHLLFFASEPRGWDPFFFTEKRAQLASDPVKRLQQWDND